MASRLKQDPDKIFDVFIEFIREPNENELGRIVRFYPRDFNDEEVLKPSVKFAFPFPFGSQRFQDEYFTFVMTDINSKFRFGFCKVTWDGHVEKNYCFISCLPWFEPFYSLLGEISSRLYRQDQEGSSILLTKLHQSNPRGPSQIISLSPPTWNEKFDFVCPIIPSLPSIPQNRNFTELFKSMRAGNLIILFSSMLFERRILMYSSSIERLTSCIHGLNQLIYPMCWQHLFIPVLPPSLLDYCSAPMPYIIGLHSSTMTKLRKIEYSDAVLVNLDENKIHSEHSDLTTIPHHVVASLKKQLKLQKALMEKSSTSIGDGASKAFLTTMVSLIGGYRNAMRFHDGADITFDPDIFVAGASFSKDPSSHLEYRRFFEMILHVQSFQQFINDRLDIMNAGKGFQDVFDRAVTSMSGDEDKWKTQSRYKDWLSQMKKQGKMLRREGKDKWTVFASKVKSKSKKTWKEMKSRLDENKKDESGPSYIKPSKHYIPQYKPPRPPPPAVPKDLRTATLLRNGMLRRNSLERTQRYNLLDVDILDSKSSSIDIESDDDLNHLKRIDTNLSNDPDLLSWMRPIRYEVLSDISWMKKSYSVEGLFNAREDAISQSALDTSMSSSGRDSLVNARSYSSANMMAKRLDNFDASSVDSSIIDVPGREGMINDKSINNDNHMSTSMSYTFKDTSTSNRSPPKLRGVDHQDWSHEDLMDFGSSNSSIEFDPLKQKVADMSFIDQKPLPLPRNKSKNLNLKNLNVLPDGLDQIDAQNPSVLPLPLPLPRKRDAASIQYYHHRKQTMNLDNQAKSFKDDQPALKYVSNSNTNDNAYGMSKLQNNDGQSFASTTKLARTLFLQSDCNIPMNNSGLETFDPLASGQLVIECPSDMPAPTSHQKSDDELLKDWDLLDITKGMAKMPFNSTSIHRHEADKQAPLNMLSGVYAASTNLIPGYPPHNPLHQPKIPQVFAGRPQYEAFNMPTHSIHPIVVPRSNKSSTLPPWTSFNSGQDKIHPDNISISRVPGGLWETFE